MFDTLHFETNKTLLEECQKLIKDHNSTSYKKVTFIQKSIEYRFISSKTKGHDPICEEIIAFYETYSSQIYATMQLRTILGSTDYTAENLAMNIDLSSDSIISLLSKLSITREKLLECRERIVANIHKQVDTFVEYLSSSITDETNIENIIDVIFTCMTQKGLRNKVDVPEEERPFIKVGSKIIEAIFKKSLLTEDLISLVKSKNDVIKQTVLENPKIQTQSINKLQTFGLIPNDGPNKYLSEVMKELFGLSMPHVESLNGAQDDIQKILQLSISDTGLPTGIIIIVSPNTDMYFDMTSLSQVTKPLGARGVTTDMVKAFDLIKVGKASTESKSALLTINVDETNTQLAYVLWTNDYQMFKFRSSPIDKPTISKLLRKAPSPTIEAYNSVFESLIKDHQTNDAINFNKVKYMSFTQEGGEEQFLSQLQESISTYILNHLGNLNGPSILDAITTNFSDGLFDILDTFKMNLGILSQQLPSHCHIIYGNIASKIVAKIKKELSNQTSIDKKIIAEILHLVIKTNDNIYSRVIAGYYLHMT